MSKKNVENKTTVVAPKADTTPEKEPVIAQVLPEQGNADKSDIEQSVEDSKENVAKGYDEVEIEPKEVVNIVVEAKDPKKGDHANADIKDVYTHPNANIEHKIVYQTDEQKQADIK